MPLFSCRDSNKTPTSKSNNPGGGGGGAMSRRKTDSIVNVAADSNGTTPRNRSLTSIDCNTAYKNPRLGFVWMHLMGQKVQVKDNVGFVYEGKAKSSFE